MSEALYRAGVGMGEGLVFAEQAMTGASAAALRSARDYFLSARKQQAALAAEDCFRDGKPQESVILNKFHDHIQEGLRTGDPKAYHIVTAGWAMGRASKLKDLFRDGNWKNTKLVMLQLLYEADIHYGALIDGFSADPRARGELRGAHSAVQAARSPGDLRNAASLVEISNKLRTILSR